MRVARTSEHGSRENGMLSYVAMKHFNISTLIWIIWITGANHSHHWKI
jgi:hypothetical protein